MKKFAILMLNMLSMTFLSAQSSQVVYPDSVDAQAVVLTEDEELNIHEYLMLNIKWEDLFVEGVRIIAMYTISDTGQIHNLQLKHLPEECIECITSFVFSLTSITRVRPAFKNGQSVESQEFIVFDFNIRR